ncbi:MAG: putative hydroxymethylpyrimidine transporter CytX [Thermoprotei archaeon]|nr:MAG: putative hydroxymethylpyrimidine transporter CytX [Thermoprotei archaeon]
MNPIIRAPPEWGIEPVPEDKKILRTLDIAVLWSSLGVGLLVMQAGALLVQWLTLSVSEAIMVSIVGSIVGSVILAAAGIIGSKYGVPTMVSFRPILGIKGTYLPSILNVLQLIGWTTFEIIIMGEAATAISGEFLGPFTRYFWMLVFSTWCILLAVYGPLTVVRQWLEKFAIWLVYASSLWITYEIIRAGIPMSGGSASISNMLLGIDLVVAMPVSWMPLISDYNRFAEKPSKGFLGTFLSYTLANAWFFSMGAALATLYPGESVVYSMALLLLGQVAILGILVDETDNAFADIYSATISLQNMFPKIRQWKLAVLIGGLSTVLAFFIPIMQYENFLLLIGASFVPLFGVLFADFFVVRKGKYILGEFYDKAPELKVSALASWVLGFTVYYLLAYVLVDFGIGATLPSLFSSFLVYIVVEYLKGGEKNESS